MLLPLSAFAGLSAQTIDGAWTGNLNMGSGLSLKLVFHIDTAKSSVSMDSPDQGAYGIQLTADHLSADSICVSSPAMKLRYSGRVAADSISGEFQQGAITLPLSFVRGVKTLNRPQTPAAPFPYTEEEVTITNETGNSVLAGTLTIPEHAEGPMAVAVLVSGSGLHNRDEEMFEHKPFAVIADRLARRGIATLRYDDRGIGKSTGPVSDATTADFASDAAAIVKMLKADCRFGKVGIIGHSEGGQIAYMLAASETHPDFIVSVAGPTVAGSAISAYQNKVSLMRSGVGEKDAEDFRVGIEKLFEYIAADPDAIKPDTDKISEFCPVGTSTETIGKLSEVATAFYSGKNVSPWLLHFWRYDPAADMERIKVPAMIVFGSKDRQVPPDLNIPAAEKYLPAARIKVYDDLNHMMQHADTGNVDEYKSIEETFCDDVISDIADFIVSVSVQ